MSDPKPSSKATLTPLEKDWRTVRGFLREHPDYLRNDNELLSEIGLLPRVANVVDFVPVALSRLAAAKTQEKVIRKQVEATARANFAAQAQTHAAVVDLLEARNHADLARRVDDTATLRFGLVAGTIAIERDGQAFAGVPAGWRPLAAGMTSQILGPEGLARMGDAPHLDLLFGERAEQVRSVALVRMAIWSPARQGVLAFGSPEPDGFTRDMGAELVAFLARVVERTAERWPAL